MTIDQIEAELNEQYRLYRYFQNTDDIHSWEKERQAREQCKIRINELKAARDAIAKAKGQS